MPLIGVMKVALRLTIAMLPAITEGSVSWERSGPPGFAAKATLSSTTGEIPDPLVLKLEVTAPNNFQADFDVIRNNLIRYNNLSAPFHLVKENIINEYTVEYTLEPLLSGIFSLTFFAIPFNAKDGTAKRIEIVSDIFEYTAFLPKAASDFQSYAAPLLPVENPLPLQMKGDLRRKLMMVTPEEASQKFIDIRSRAIPWQAIAGFFFMAAVYLSIKLAPKRRGKPKTASNTSEMSFDLAAELLKKLNKEGSPEVAKAYFSALTDAVRYRIEERGNLAAMAQTSEEFLRDVCATHALEGGQADQLAAFLRICDAVKFGKYRPSPQESTLAYATAGHLIAARFKLG